MTLFDLKMMKHKTGSRSSKCGNMAGDFTNQ